MVTPLLVQALHRQSTPRPPVWFMRQAGRYLPEYRAIRANFPNFIEFCLNSQAAAEVTLQPIQRFGLDAAIIFSDILVIPHALGQSVTFAPNHGPIVEKVTTPAHIHTLANHLSTVPEKLAPMAETIRLTRQGLTPQQAVIGFSGAPFTLAGYMVDEKPSLGTPKLIKLAEEDPTTFTTLIATLTQAIISYLRMQADAGAHALQVFDSWAGGSCPPRLWEQAVAAPLRTIATALKETHPAVPVILFPRLTTQGQLLGLLQPSPAFAALSLSTQDDLAWAAQHLQPHVAIQGNLDPHLFTLEDPIPLAKALQHALATAGQNPGYIVNLGHGLTPETNPARIQQVVETLHNLEK